jgi:uncharacterized membrane protein YfcA
MTFLFFLVFTPVLLFITLGYPNWYYGEPIANISIFLYLYLGTWISIKGSAKKFNKYFGENGLYIPEESIFYRYKWQLGKINICVLPKGKYG